MALDYKALMKKVEDSQKQANEQNLARYEQLIASITTLTEDVVGAGGTYDQAAALVENIGQSARQRIGEAAVRAGAMSEQDLTSRGLGSTTIRAAAQRGIAADKTKAELAQSESEARQKSSLLLSKAGARMGLGQMMAGAIEGRYDQGPDLGMFASLMQAASSAATEEKRTVSIGSGLPGPGFVTRKQAAAAVGAGGSMSGGSQGGSQGGLPPGGGHSTGVRTITGFPASPSTGGGGGSQEAVQRGPASGLIRWGDDTQQVVGGGLAGTLPGAPSEVAPGGTRPEAMPPSPTAGGPGGTQSPTAGEEGWTKGKTMRDGSYIEMKPGKGGYSARKMSKEGQLLSGPVFTQTARG